MINSKRGEVPARASVRAGSCDTAFIRTDLEAFTSAKERWTNPAVCRCLVTNPSNHTASREGSDPPFDHVCARRRVSEVSSVFVSVVRDEWHEKLFRVLWKGPGPSLWLKSGLKWLAGRWDVGVLPTGPVFFIQQDTGNILYMLSWARLLFLYSETQFGNHRFFFFKVSLTVIKWITSLQRSGEVWKPVVHTFTFPGAAECWIGLSVYFASVRQQSGVVALEGADLKLLFYKY